MVEYYPSYQRAYSPSYADCMFELCRTGLGILRDRAAHGAAAGVLGLQPTTTMSRHEQVGVPHRLHPRRRAPPLRVGGRAGPG